MQTDRDDLLWRRQRDPNRPEAAAPGRVYIVDDDRIALHVMARILHVAGHEVEAFESPPLFLAAFRSGRPCCVVLDLRMPEIDGFEVMDALHRMDPGVPVIFVSGQASVPDAVRAMKAGPFDFLCKPVESAALRGAVRGALERDAARRAAANRQDAITAAVASLSDRERDVCRLVARGLLNKEIASTLGLAERTVKYHRARGMQKLGVDSVQDLVRVIDRAVVSAPSKEGS